MAGKRLAALGYEVRKVRTANFLLQFPEKLDVEWHTVLHRKARCQQGCQGWPLIVGGATSQITLTIALEHKGILLPLRLVGWLYVQVIVDSDRRIRWIDSQLAKYHRIARGLDDLNCGSTVLEERGGLVRTLLDVRGMHRVHTDGRNL